MGDIKIVNYISSPYETPIIYITEGNLRDISKAKEGFHYLARDFQGSIMAIYDENANVIERRLFDPWGNIVKVQDKNGAVTEGENAKLIFLDRGYTGHEHFTEVGIIHMNGRIYDPMLKQFLSPDNFIQDSENSQNYNRYGYVWNNPLKYTDPSGELAAETAFLIGAAIGALTYTVGILVSNRSFSFSDFMTSTIMGGISGVASYGVGTLVSNIMPSITNIGTQFAHTVVSASFHAISQGVIAGISGGDFIQSFASALISSAVASSVQGAGSIGSWEDSGLRTILFGTVSGGLTAELTGENFWQGAAIGLVVSGLNHAAHDDNGYEKDGKGGYKKINDNGGDTTDYLYENGKIIEQKTPFSFGGEVSTNRSYGVLEYQGTGGATIDPTGHFVYGGAEAKLGYGILKFGLTKLPKVAYGLRVGLGGSKTMLKSSYLFKYKWGFDYSMGISLPTFMFNRTANLGVFLGRNTAAAGAVIMFDGMRRMINF